MSNPVPFRPIQGTEEKIQGQAILQGNIYFTTDTGKIMLDTDNERIVLGNSGAAVYYANAQNLNSNTDDTYTIYVKDLDDIYAQPQKDDLIINGDGRFFRVNYYNDTLKNMSCKLIAVSGTGGGGGGGSSDVDDPKTIDVVYDNLKYSFLFGEKYCITLTATSKLDTYLNISYTVRNSSGTTGFGTAQIKSGQTIPLEVYKYITPEGGYHAVDISISGANSRQYSTTLNRIKCVVLKVENDIDNFTSQKIYNNVVPYYVNVEGQIDKVLYIEVDGKPFSERALSSSETGSINMDIDCKKNNITTGVHTIKAYLIADGVPSNEVVTDFIYHPDNAPDNTYIILIQYPSKCMSYENPEVEYWVYNTAYTDGYENSINLIVNGVKISEEKQVQKTGESLKWNVTNLNSNAENICEIQCANSRTFKIYCEHSTIFDPTSDGLLMAFSANGRTNNVSLERRLEWEYNSSKGNFSANLKDFNWNNNGWLKDSATNKDCLRVSNGASVEIPFYLFENESPTNGGYTLEFEFKPYNLYSYNLLTQSTTTVEKDNEEDDEVEIKREFNADLAAISYIYTGNDGKAYGLCCGTQDAFFRMSDGQNVSVRYTNDEIVTITVTINAAQQQICMYVNGVMSGMTAYQRDSAKLPISANKLIINSKQCDLDLFNIRVYEAALTSSQVVQNYISNTKDLAIYNQNTFSSKNNTIKLSDLQTYNADNPSNATIPYIIFKTKEELPYNKANEDVICSIEFVNPALDYALAKGEIDEEYYKTHAPSFTADNVTFNVQGTSSQKYPRKNFKGKFKKAKNWQCREESVSKKVTGSNEDLVIDKSLSKFYMNENIAEKTICWKADYMDSSSCHNTGFVSYVQELYKNHPLDYYEGTAVAAANKDGQTGEYYKKYRTSLYGFPVLAFHEKSADEIEFIGRYNFNLDKGADDTLGMALEKQHPILTDTTYDKVCECWEMANNLGGRCSFRGNPFDYGYDYELQKYTAYNADGTVNANAEGTSDIGDDIEVRYYHDDKKIEGAWKNLTAPEEDGGTPISSKEAFEVLLGGNADGSNRTGVYKELEKLFKWLKSCYYAFDMNTVEDREWVKDLLGREPLMENGKYYKDSGEPYDEDFAQLINERKTKFENEFEKHFNMEYCLVYYIMTELLLQYDSRGKNMMLSSWGPMEVGGEYIWFPIYYDVDTQLGVNNSGIPSWEYNVEPTTGFNNPGGGKAFSTANSLLWNNFHQSYAVNSNIVQQRYRALRGGNLNIAKLNGYYNFDYNISKAYCMKGILPITVMNANQHYKYIEPSISGYVIGKNEDGSPKYRTTSAYFYCLQGTRDLHRAQLLRNRFNYYDSKWMAQDYQPGTGGSAMRWRANTSSVEDINDPLYHNLILKVKPALDQYLVVWLDDSATYVYPTFVKGGDIATVDLSKYLSSSEYQQQLVYIGGYKYLQEFGNVSLLYLDEFEYPDDATNIVKIELGNENENYKPNSAFKTDAIPEAATNKPLLKVFDISNIDSIESTITLSDSIKLETFKALGTKINGAIFADGVNLRHLYLPNTTTEINLNRASNLNKVIYDKNNLKEYDENGNLVDAQGLYIQDVVIEDGSKKKTNLNKINIVGGSFKLHSYDLLNKVTNAVKDMDGTLAINLLDVQWTPFTQLGEGADYDSSKASKYYYATNNYSFEEYKFENEEQWQSDILNGRVYEYSESDITIPTDLSLLDTYINDPIINTAERNGPQHFTNITDTLKKSYPSITGEMYINNTIDISEADLDNKYKQYFPALTIRAKKIGDAYRARFVSIENGVEKEEAVYRYEKTESDIVIEPLPITQVTPPIHYDCVGWSLTPNGEIIKDFSIFDFDENHTEYVFYAVFKLHSYQIEYINPKANIQDAYNEIINIEYGQKVSEPSKIPTRNFENSQITELEDRIAFKGWTLQEEQGGIVDNTNLAAILVNPTDYTVDKDYRFYAVFVRESVYDSVLESKYLNFEWDNSDQGYYISLNRNYELSGKITLPLKYNDKPIVAVKSYGFNPGEYNNKITHIFWDKNTQSELKIIKDYAFAGATTLQYFEFIDSIETIDKSGFAGADLGLNSSKLPNSLITIGESAFNACPNFKISEIGNKVKTIGANAFSSTIQVENLIIGDSVQNIGINAFTSYHTTATGKNVALKKVTIGKGIITIGENAFESRNSDNTLFETLEEIVLDVKRDKVVGSPWGAVKAVITWIG